MLRSSLDTDSRNSCGSNRSFDKTSRTTVDVDSNNINIGTLVPW